MQPCLGMDALVTSTFSIAAKRHVQPLLFLSLTLAMFYFMCTSTCLLNSNFITCSQLWQHPRGLYRCGTKPAIRCKSILWWVAWCNIFCHCRESTCVINLFISKEQYLSDMQVNMLLRRTQIVFVLVSATWLQVNFDL